MQICFHSKFSKFLANLSPQASELNNSPFKMKHFLKLLRVFSSPLILKHTYYFSVFSLQLFFQP